MTIFSENTTNNATTLDEITGSFLSTSFEMSDSTFKISNIYTPVRPAERLTFFNNIKDRITNDMILGGDWNCVPQRPRRYLRRTKQEPLHLRTPT